MTFCQKGEQKEIDFESNVSYKTLVFFRLNCQRTAYEVYTNLGNYVKNYLSVILMK